MQRNVATRPPGPSTPPQVLKNVAICQAEVIAVSGNTATVRLDVLLPASVWAGHQCWHDSPGAAQLFAHLVPPPQLPPPGVGQDAAEGSAQGGAAAPQQQQQGEEEEQEEPASYVQLLRRGLPDLRPVPEGADPFR